MNIKLILIFAFYGILRELKTSENSHFYTHNGPFFHKKHALHIKNY